MAKSEETATISGQNSPETSQAASAIGGTEPTETTRLLETSNGAGSPEIDASARKHSWIGFQEFEHLPWYRTPSIYWLVGPYALFTLAYGGTIVPKLNLIIDLVCHRLFSDRLAEDPSLVFAPITFGGDNPQCHNAEVQRKVATFMLAIGVITGTLSAFTAPRFGSWSDRVGRKKIMALVSIGGIAGELITILAANYPEVISYKWLLLGAFSDGLGGSFTAASVLSNSYASDCTPPSQRSVAIGMLHACLFIGLALGPLVSAYFVKWAGSLVSIFYVSLGCHVLFILFILFVIPESLSERRQAAAREKHLIEQDLRAKKDEDWVASMHPTNYVSRHNDFFTAMVQRTRTAPLLASFRNVNPFLPLKALWPTGPGTKRARRNLVLLAAIDVVILGAAMSVGPVTILYSEYMFHWTNFETSRFISLLSGVRVIVLLGLFPIINYLFRIIPARRKVRETGIQPTERNAGADELDIWILRIAIFSDVVGVLGYVLARSAPLFVLAGVFTAFGGLGSATIQAALSKHVSAERVGQLLGAIGLLQALSRIVAPVLFNGLYAATITYFPQAVYVLLLSMFGVVLVLSFMVRPHVYVKDEVEQVDDEEEEEILGHVETAEARRRAAVTGEALMEDEVAMRI